ncbi:MAG: hypothetical protein QXF12_00060 [Candidatus Aenigmatarchaeota archaeon]
MMKYSRTSFYTINEIASMLNTSYSSIYRIIKTNSITVVKTKNYNLVRGSDIPKIRRIYKNMKNKNRVFKSVTRNASRKR